MSSKDTTDTFNLTPIFCGVSTMLRSLGQWPQSQFPISERFGTLTVIDILLKVFSLHSIRKAAAMDVGLYVNGQ